VFTSFTVGQIGMLRHWKRGLANGSVTPREARSGRIINLSSVVGHTGNAGQSLYAATKAAITGFTQSIAQELAAAGILCNCVAPGFIATDMTKDLKEEVKQSILARVPLKRLGTPEDIANAVEFLASDRANYITGTTIHVNGGMYTT
jgi:3-oxoacyl-[acyl-carrier protein] reductase